MGRASGRTSLAARDRFTTLFGATRGLNPQAEVEAKERRKSDDERRRDEDTRHSIERDRLEQAERTAMVARIRAVFDDLLDEQDEWGAPELREAARLRLPNDNPSWINVVLMNMCGDGGWGVLTTKLRIRRAPVR